MSYSYSLTRDELKQKIMEKVDSSKVKDEHIDILITLTYRSRHKSIANFSQISSEVRSEYNKLKSDLPTIIQKEVASDGTVKFLLELEDKNSIEMVLLPFYKKYTLCISSQVGCAMGCEFCFTAKQGFKRNLKAHEIISQVILAKDYLRTLNKDKRNLTNIVFMGQGEPLHNFENIKRAINIFQMRDGLSISEKNITVSSVGFLPGLKRFDELGGVNFALSLHAVDEGKRTEIIPLNQKYPLDKIISVIDEMKLRKKQTIEYEYILIKDLNDTAEDARKLNELLKDRTHMINIIPFNPFPNTKFKKPELSDIKLFKQYCVDLGLRAMIRTTKGDEILAACGQLNSKKEGAQL